MVNKLFLAVLLGLALLIVLVSFGQRVEAQGGPQAPVLQTTVSPYGTSAIAPQALTYKLMSNPYCYQPDPSVDQCILNIRYAQLTDNGTTAPYMLRWVVSVNGKVRMVENLFFENNVYYSYDMAPLGIKVPCGAPNAGGGGTAYGNIYLVKAEPLDSTGTGMGYDQASLYCPAFAP